MARYGKKSLSLLLTLVLLLGLLTGLGMQAAAAELPQYAADGTMTELAEGAKTAAGTRDRHRTNARQIAKMRLFIGDLLSSKPFIHTPCCSRWG